MRLTTKGRYGVRAVLNLAAQNQNDPVSISKISQEEDLSPEFLEQIFFKLKKAGLIRSIRGPKGGFVLNWKPSDVTIKAILDAVGEPVNPTPCTDENSDPCPREKDCAMASVWNEFYEVIENHLAGISLKDIMENRKTAVSLGLKG
ncbi:MAG: RrF2 family transcriptional regulator [Spirochaetaceae bacterium]|nr:MAG: RrF2 family transcriptional regulator [Spirochaetaceae bacterium]